MLDGFVYLGRCCFVDMFGFMHLCVLLPNAVGGGFCPCRFCAWLILGVSGGKDLDNGLLFLILRGVSAAYNVEHRQVT